MGRSSTSSDDQRVPTSPQRSDCAPAGKAPKPSRLAGRAPKRLKNEALALLASRECALQLALLAPPPALRWTVESAEQSSKYAEALKTLHGASRDLPDDYGEVVSAVDWLSQNKKAADMTDDDRVQFEGAHEMLLAYLLRDRAEQYRRLFG